jgi:hypothetical protein
MQCNFSLVQSFYSISTSWIYCIRSFRSAEHSMGASILLAKLLTELQHRIYCTVRFSTYNHGSSTIFSQPENTPEAKTVHKIMLALGHFCRNLGIVHMHESIRCGLIKRAGGQPLSSAGLAACYSAHNANANDWSEGRWRCWNTSSR